jgi:hypothetical protein
MGNPRGALQALDLAEKTARNLMERNPGRHEDRLATVMANKATIAMAEKQYILAAGFYANAVDLLGRISNIKDERFAAEFLNVLLGFVAASVKSDHPRVIIESCRVFLRAVIGVSPEINTAVLEFQKFAVFSLAKACSENWDVPHGRENFIKFSQDFGKLAADMGGIDTVYEFAVKSEGHPRHFGDWRNPVPSGDPGAGVGRTGERATSTATRSRDQFHDKRIL